MAMAMANHHTLGLIFGILGNIISFLVYFAPAPTFYRIYKRKSAEGFHSLPYIVALFSAMLWLYYALLKKDAFLLITINCFGCAIESFYILLYFFYAPMQAKKQTLKVVISLNVGVFSILVVLIQFLLKGSNRINVFGWICASFSVAVFAAPLSIVAKVIRTKSVEFMPFSLSFFLTLSAIMWFAYGLLKMTPVLLNAGKEKMEKKLPEHIIDMVMLSTLGTSDIHPIGAQQNGIKKSGSEDVKDDEETGNREKSTENSGELQPNGSTV
ncbi:Bidirectional sugar transporter SWEET15 [Vitis vinifera]|uniref:Bidirectional sugar transporter SWEET n=1 Tax=Vitis vinifera TaxID=29760 RepID=A0A438D946_VITVI|nr:Bidirectional sugar transporter SWEET15 [Vitis vinifera]